MKGKIFAVFAVFAMVAMAFGAIGASALETNVIPGPTHWYTSLDGNAKIIGDGKSVEGTAHTSAYLTMNIPRSGVGNFIKIETEGNTYTYCIHIETVTYNDNAQTLTIKFTEGTLHNGKVTNVGTITSGYGMDWYATRTTYTVTGMRGSLTFDDGMKVKLSDMSGKVAYEAWYQTQTLDKLDGIEDGVYIEL